MAIVVIVLVVGLAGGEGLHQGGRISQSRRRVDKSGLSDDSVDVGLRGRKANGDDGGSTEKCDADRPHGELLNCRIRRQAA